VSGILNYILLLSAPGLPLLLAFPALRWRFSRPCHIALLPAVVLLAFPAGFSIELPWLLFGTELGIDGTSRLLLALSVVLWAAAGVFLQVPEGQSADNRFTTYYLLTLAASLGAILAVDMVGFFAFSSLMGYAFYALLVAGGGEGSRRAGRIYLGLLILADLALFEALLIAAAASDDLSFEAVHQALAGSPSLGLYLSMVLIGFAAKAGVWPLHFWLPLVFGSSRPPVALLLGGVPVAVGLLGAVRWLPLGEIISPDLGLVIQGLGVAAMLFAILSGVKQASLTMLPVHATILATGVFTITIGAGLTDLAAWGRYENRAHYFIAALGCALALLVIAIRWLEARRHYPAAPAKQADDSSLRLERWSGAVVAWAETTGYRTLPKWRVLWRVKMSRPWLVICAWKSALAAGERTLQRWTFAITLFLLLGMAVVFVGASPWR